MATKKTTSKKTSSRSTRKEADTTSSRTSSPMEYFKFGESYTSLILGIVVVIIASILLISFVRNREGIELPSGDTPDISSTEIGPDTEDRPGEYTVKEGDDLWSIAETQTGSGYNWIAIQEANEITNPNDIAAGSKLVIPTITETQPTTVATSVTPSPQVTNAPTATPTPANDTTTQKPAITGTEYTIVAGDTLWGIAERRYKSGYEFTRIAQVNNIANPNWILAGQKISLPN